MTNVGPDPAPRKRALRLRTPLTCTAALVSQLTSLALLGVDPRRYLDVVVPACRPDVIHVGRLRLVELSRAVEVLRSMAAADAPASGETDDDDDQLTTPDAVLRAWGRELAR